MGMDENITAGKYQPKLPYVSLKDASQLTQASIAHKAYTAEVIACEVQFYKDAEEELGIANNPKKQKFFEIAYNMGHSTAGFYEIWGYMQDIVELIK
jgi:hypothetical protein